MPGMPPPESGTAVDDAADALNLPLASMVRALCRAANTDTDILYDVMLKAALMVDAAAHTYGMATFAQKPGERPHLKWVEGLDADEIAEAVLPRLRDLLGVSRAIVNLFDLAAGEVEWLAAVGRRELHVGPGVRFPLRLMGDLDGLRRGELQVVDTASLPRDASRVPATSIAPSAASAAPRARAEVCPGSTHG